jgi:hypothetical protein
VIVRHCLTDCPADHRADDPTTVLDRRADRHPIVRPLRSSAAIPSLEIVRRIVMATEYRHRPHTRSLRPSGSR